MKDNSPDHRQAWQIALLVAAMGCGTEVGTPRSEGPVQVGSSTTVVARGPAWPRDEGFQVTDTLLRLGAIYNGPETLFSDVVGALRLSDGSVVMLDGQTSQLRRFAPSGQHLWSTGRKGDGPGEFRTPLALWRADGDHLYVEDPSSRAVFTADGNLVEHRRFDWAAVQALGRYYSDCRHVRRSADEMYLLSTCAEGSGIQRPTGPWDIVNAFTVIPPSLDWADTVGVFLQERTWAIGAVGQTMFLPPPLAERGIFALGGRPLRLAYGTSHHYRIEIFTLESKPERMLVIERPAGHRTPTQQEIEAGWRSWDRMAEVVTAYPEVADVRADVAEATKRVAPPDSVSLIGRMLIDDTNHLWVMQHLGKEREVAIWDVFSDDGEYLGEVELPANLEPTEIGSDYVLGVVTEEFDVEYVVLLRLDRGRPLAEAREST